MEKTMNLGDYTLGEIVNGAMNSLRASFRNYDDNSLKRLAICEVCPSAKRNGKWCDKAIGGCGCDVTKKVKLPQQHCPDNWWLRKLQQGEFEILNPFAAHIQAQPEYLQFAVAGDTLCLIINGKQCVALSPPDKNTISHVVFTKPWGDKFRSPYFTALITIEFDTLEYDAAQMIFRPLRTGMVTATYTYQHSVTGENGILSSIKAPLEFMPESYKTGVERYNTNENNFIPIGGIQIV